MTMGGLLVAGSATVGLRFLVYFLQGQGTGKIQSLILAAILAIVGFQICLVGLIADAVSMNRRMLEETLYRVRCTELEQDREENR